MSATGDSKVHGRLKSRSQVLVIGAGVIGLTTARALATNGYRVTVLAKDFMSVDNRNKLTSQVAAAIWQMPLGAHGFQFDNDDNIREWCKSTYRQFTVLGQRSQDTGVFMREHVYPYRQMIKDSPSVMGLMKEHTNVPGFRHSAELIKEKGLSGTGLVDAFSFYGPMIETDVFLVWLTGQLLSKGVDFIRGSISGPLRTQTRSIKQQYGVDWIVNCTGLGSEEIAEDATMYPYRGFGVIVHKSDLNFQPPDCVFYSSTYWHDEENKGKGHMIIAPRGNHSLFIGTCMQETTDRNLSPSSPIVRRMLSESAAYYPPLRSIAERDMGLTVGFRPMRPGGPRVEHDPECHALIHNYGHCSIGILLSLGCAEHVLKILNELVMTSKL